MRGEIAIFGQVCEDFALPNRLLAQHQARWAPSSEVISGLIGPGGARFGETGGASTQWPAHGKNCSRSIVERVNRANGMAICATCGKENRDKALFCLGCARPLGALAGDSGPKTPEPLETPGAQTGASNGIDAVRVKAQPSSVWRWMALCAGVAVVLGIGLKHWKSSFSASHSAALTTPAAQAAPPAIAPQTVSAPTVPKETFLEPGHTEVVVEERTRVQELGEPLKTVDARSAQADKIARANAVRAAQRQSVEDARQAASRADAASPDLVAAPIATSAAAPKPEVSVEKACSQSSNFFARDLCRIDACRKPSKAGDPICVWFRKLEEERRNKITF